MELAMMHGWMMTLWWIVGLAVVAALVAAAVLAFRNFGGSTGPRRARDVLDERYANGEIDDDEYQQRRRMLHRTR